MTESVRIRCDTNSDIPFHAWGPLPTIRLFLSFFFRRPFPLLPLLTATSSFLSRTFSLLPHSSYLFTLTTLHFPIFLFTHPPPLFSTLIVNGTHFHPSTNLQTQLFNISNILLPTFSKPHLKFIPSSTISYF